MSLLGLGLSEATVGLSEATVGLSEATLGLIDLLQVPSNKMPLEQRLMTDFVSSPSLTKGGRRRGTRRGTRGTRRRTKRRK